MHHELDIEWVSELDANGNWQSMPILMGVSICADRMPWSHPKRKRARDLLPMDQPRPLRVIGGNTTISLASIGWMKYGINRLDLFSDASGARETIAVMYVPMSVNRYRRLQWRERRKNRATSLAV